VNRLSSDGRPRMNVVWKAGRKRISISAKTYA